MAAVETMAAAVTPVVERLALFGDNITDFRTVIRYNPYKGGGKLYETICLSHLFIHL